MMNIVLPRRNFKKKVRVIKPFNDLEIGDILESVTQRRGNYSGILRGVKNKKRHIPVSYAEEIKQPKQ